MNAASRVEGGTVGMGGGKKQLPCRVHLRESVCMAAGKSSFIDNMPMGGSECGCRVSFSESATRPVGLDASE